jgi:hypothetical protein
MEQSMVEIESRWMKSKQVSVTELVWIEARVSMKHLLRVLQSVVLHPESVVCELHVQHVLIRMYVGQQQLNDRAKASLVYLIPVVVI